VDEEVTARVALCSVPGLRRAQAQRLIDRFGSARAVLGARAETLAAWAPRRLAEALARAGTGREAESRIADAASRGIHAFAPGSEDFPSILAAIPDPPLMLWLRGVVPQGPALSIVGARRASARGLATARGFATELAHVGVAVVSGLAYGIDAAAHEGALAGRGPTVAVLASGLDRVTPTGQRALAERILAAGGAWLSEHAPGEGAHPHHFPERNRLISGLSSATLIVEAREKSGSLWTARHALEQGRDVLVVPGPIDSELCRGTNRLLRDGATPILEAADAIEAVLGPLARLGPLGGGVARASGVDGPSRVGDHGGAILALLADGPRDADDVARALGLGASVLAGALLELELTGLLRREGSRLARTRPA
jgi:DNA processing protein